MTGTAETPDKIAVAVNAATLMPASRGNVSNVAEKVSLHAQSLVAESAKSFMTVCAQTAETMVNLAVKILGAFPTRQPHVLAEPVSIAEEKEKFAAKTTNAIPEGYVNLASARSAAD